VNGITCSKENYSTTHDDSIQNQDGDDTKILETGPVESIHLQGSIRFLTVVKNTGIFLLELKTYSLPFRKNPKEAINSLMSPISKSKLENKQGVSLEVNTLKYS
jgi:hypothetical protein